MKGEKFYHSSELFYLSSSSENTTRAQFHANGQIITQNIFAEQTQRRYVYGITRKVLNPYTGSYLETLMKFNKN